MALHLRVVNMKNQFLRISCILIISASLLGCAASDRLFDSNHEANPKVRHASYVDKVNAFKLFIPPHAWRVVSEKRTLLALESRTCAGKVMLKSKWFVGANLSKRARKVVAGSFVGECEWLDSNTFLVNDCPAIIVSGRGSMLYSRAEKFQVERTVAVGVVKYGTRVCLFKYVAPYNCYLETKDDFLELVKGFRRFERHIFGGKEGEN